ncbi:MAG: YihY/virulence factor BrkB family protein [Robiginitomaculum sp.]|nr:YihY/virulence factor BrkB family protein [Robiginitomaculum sp.]
MTDAKIDIFELLVKNPFLFLRDVHRRFVADDGFALSGNIAFSSLLAFFPFLIFLTALAGFLGNEPLARTVIDYLLSVAPAEIVEPVSDDIHSILTVSNKRVLTLSIAFTLYIATGGVESLRVGFNRAYGLGAEMRRPWWMRFLQNLAFVIGGAGVLLVLAVLIVFAPLWWDAAASRAEFLDNLSGWFHLLRIPIGLGVMFLALSFGHLFLPRKRLQFRQVLPGILATMVLWLLAAKLYAQYTAEFSRAQIMYAGLGSVVIALLFVYISAALVILGGEFNEVLIERKSKKQNKGDM